jgi:hypothetical protein
LVCIPRSHGRPDAARKGGNYFLYFPAMDADGVFRIGCATSRRPEGPFVADPRPIAGTYSIDPSAFADDDGEHYLLWGGIWGGQLHRWESGDFDADPAAVHDTGKGAAVAPRIARLTESMHQLAHAPHRVIVHDPSGAPILAADRARRFFEGAWMHKHAGTYYLSYSTGDTHCIVYATARSPYGPFTFRGVLSPPVHGWTHHHSIVQVDGQWRFYYHDAEISGQTHLRHLKRPVPLTHQEDGSILAVDSVRGKRYAEERSRTPPTTSA